MGPACQQGEILHFFLKQADVWLATRSLLTVLSSAYAMWAQPWGSRSSLMKSSRLRLELGATQAMPRLQISPTCIGVVVTCVIVQIALPGLEVRFSDWAAYKFQLHVGG